MTKFRNKYRIESNRMPGWDYSGNGVYFITLVVQGRKCLLGKIENGKMILSDFGKIAEEEWHKSFEIRKELILDEFVIMPNHLHAIIIIDKTNETGSETHGRASRSGRASRFYSTSHYSISPEFHRKPKSISSFVAGYKTGVTG